MKKLLFATTALVALAAGPAHADPISATAAWVASTFAVSAATATFIVNFAVSTALSAIGTALAKSRMDRPGANVSFQVEMGDDLPLSFTVGEYATAGKRKYIGSWGKNTRFITEVIEVSALPQGFSGMWVNDERGQLRSGVVGHVPAWGGPGAVTGSTTSASAPAGTYSLGTPLSNYEADGQDARIWVKWVDGTQTAADPLLVWLFGEDEDYPWTSAMVGRGKAYAIVTTRYDKEELTNYPQWLFEPAPLPVYDWRFDSTNGGSGSQRWGDRSTYQPSRNPAVIAYNVARGVYYGSEWVFGGKGLAAWRLPIAEWTAAANACDQQINIVGGGTQARYRCGMEIAVDMEPASVLEELGKAANMKFAEVGGRLKPIVELPGAAVFSFTDSDILITEGQSYNPFYPVAETFNAISATYPERGEKWASKDAPEYVDAEATASDGGQYLPTSVQYGAVPFGRQVQRLMRSQMRDFRRMRRHQFYLPPDAYALEPGIDMVSWTSERNGYVNKQFLVESVNKTPGMNVLVSLREVDPADYDWSSSFEQPIVITPPVNPKPFVQGAAGFGAVPHIFSDGAGQPRRPGIMATYDGSETGVTQIRIQARVAGQTENAVDTLRRFEEPFRWPVRDVLPATAYQVRGRLFSDLTPRGAWSDWITVTTDDVRLGAGDISLDGIADEVRESLGDLTDWMDGTGEVIRDVRDEIDAIRDLAAEQDFGNMLARDGIRREVAVEVGNARASFNEQIDVVVGDLAAQAARTTTLRAEFNSTTAAYNERLNVFASDQRAIAQRTTTLEADLGEAKAEYREQIDAVADDLVAAVAVTTELRADFNGNVATVTEDLLALAREDEALSGRIDEVSASIGDAVGEANQSLIARVSDVEGEQQVQSDAITQVSARTNRGTANGTLRATAQSGPAGVQSMIGLRAEASDNDSSHSAALYLRANTNGSSDVIVSAGRFSVATGQDANGPQGAAVPFVVRDNQVRMTNAIVDTLSLAGNAVTVSASQTLSTDLFGTGEFNWHTANQVNFTMPEAGKATVLWFGQHGFSSLGTALAHGLRLLVNGTQIWSRGGQILNDYPNAGFKIDLPKGANVIRMDWRGYNSTINLFSRTLIVDGTMR